MKKRVGKKVGLAVGVLFFGALTALGVTYYREIWAILTRQDARDAFAAYVQQSGWTGLAAFLGLQVLQVVVAFLPGEPLELMAGALYGTWGGLVVCMVGLLIGSVLVYSVVRLLGASRVDPALLHRYRFLRDDQHVYAFLFLLYFIPGTPKDMLLYIGPFLPVRSTLFFAIALMARIPSVITSTYAGAHLMRGDWRTSLVVFAVTGAAALLCLWKQEAILRLLRTWKNRRRSLSEAQDACAQTDGAKDGLKQAAAGAPDAPAPERPAETLGCKEQNDML